MFGKHLSVGISLFFAVSGACLAATLAGQGVIRFQGSIVEPGCTSHVGANSTVELNGCPTSARGSASNAVGVEPVRSVTALDHSRVDVKLVSESSKDGRYYDRQYALVDGAGKPLKSGSYLITLTAP